MGLDDCGRCEQCGGRPDRPSFYEPCQKEHPPADVFDELVQAIEHEINGRKGIGWEGCDDHVQDEIMDDLKEIVKDWTERRITG